MRPIVLPFSNNSTLPCLLNTISKSKKPDESDFRVHFIIKDVRWKCKQPNKEQKLIDHVYLCIKKRVLPHIIQICYISNNEMYDLSVGLYNDVQAYHFLKNNECKIKISDGAKDWEYPVVVSRAFQYFVNRVKRNQGILGTLAVEYKGNENEQQVGDSKQQQVDKKQQITQKLVNKVWFFGIPKQFQIDQICSQLSSKIPNPQHPKWRYKQFMQYLQIQLQTPVPKNSIYFLSPSVNNYPIIPVPASQETDILKQLSLYTVCMTIKSIQDDEDMVIKYMDAIGGVNMILRTPNKQKTQIRYLIIFNSVDKAQKGCNVVKSFRGCTAEKGVSQFRVCRLGKFWTFRDLVTEMKENGDMQ